MQTNPQPRFCPWPVKRVVAQDHKTKVHQHHDHSGGGEQQVSQKWRELYHLAKQIGQSANVLETLSKYYFEHD